MPTTKRTIKLKQANAAGQEFIRVENKQGVQWAGCTSRLPLHQGVRHATFTITNITYTTPIIPGLPKALLTSGQVTTRHRISVDPRLFQPRPRVFVKYNKPCPTSNFKELSFEEFTRAYHAYLAGRSSPPATPEEPQ